MRARPRLLIVLSLVAALACLAALGYYVARPTTANSLSGSAQSCAPQPCLAPGGFQAYFSDVQISGGKVALRAKFINHTQELLEAVSYRHTSPADFQILWPDGSKHDPIFGSDCPAWDEIKVERGSTVGPETLCFDARPTTGLSGVLLIWNPDLGFFSSPVSTHLSP